MQNTIFKTPVLSLLLRWISSFILIILGWRKEGQLPDVPKLVLIAAPHTSNWDLFFTLVLAFSFRMKVYWMGKEALFRWPYGRIMRWLAGISIDRSKSNNVVEQSVQAFQDSEQLIMVVPPEGSRGKVKRWRTGFYYIAYGAKVPIVLGFIDYGRKVGGFGPAIHPTGDIDADMEQIKAFYANVTGKKQDKFSKPS